MAQNLGEGHMVFIAHISSSDSSVQTLGTHLTGVAEITARLASKIGSENAGRLIGLMHDFGKYSLAFLNYIKSATELINPDEDEYVAHKAMKGKIDHSTAGAQWVFQALKNFGSKGQGEFCGQILAVCIASHHSGLIDCLTLDGDSGFKKRIEKPDEDTHLEECKRNADSSILNQAQHLANESLVREMLSVINQIRKAKNAEGQTLSALIREFYWGFYTRFLFSCLIDADRMNSADFETPENALLRSKGIPDWGVAIERLETKLGSFPVDTDVAAIRKKISDQCLEKSNQAQGIYTLSVPTGGGKTLASLRYALNHAKKHGLERIIYVIPYTSIIEQNASEVRKILQPTGETFEWVLEHHSNLEPEVQTWRSKLVSDNWDAPVIFTTMVQLLETMFGGGTRGVRRLHQLANSVLIFDEIQTLPIKCVHLFCNAINFLTDYAKTTTVLCTATQPLLNQLQKPENGQLHVAKENEIIPNVSELYQRLERVQVENKCKDGGWSKEEIVEFAMRLFEERQSCLMIVNTKKWAQDLFLEFQRSGVDPEALFHLSTNQCPAHRKAILDKVRQRLKDGEPVLCVSTQLIEAGVDVSFADVIRFLAGLDSIAQAAGRCNRHGELKNQYGEPIKGRVYVLNPDQESTDMLADIEVGKRQAERVLSEMPNASILSPEAMQRYFQYYFFDRTKDMVYKTTLENGIDNTLLNLLSSNAGNNFAQNNEKRAEQGFFPLLMQSFMTAGKAFKAIDAPTQSVIVPYGEGKEIIKALCAVNNDFSAKAFHELLKKAQKYSVNVFPNLWKQLMAADALVEIQGEGVFYLNEQHYSQLFGVTLEGKEKMSVAMC
jgi:CRISPR-associated endonuclease/helicase Cas3